MMVWTLALFFTPRNGPRMNRLVSSKSEEGSIVEVNTIAIDLAKNVSPSAERMRQAG